MKLTKQFISSRMEYLEEILRTDAEFQEQTKIAHEAGKKFEEAVNRGEGIWEKYIEFEELQTQKNVLYSELVYKLSHNDTLQLVLEHQMRTRKSVLSVQDMEHMLYLYDAAKKLSTVFYGKSEACHTDGNIFDRIFCVIESGVCSEIAMLGKNDATDKIVSILDDDGLSLKEKARILTGLQEMDGDQV